MSAPTSSLPPLTEAVDSGWDDVPEGAPAPAGKRRPHRQRRVSANTAPSATVAANSVLMPRPAEPTKKQQREHARKQRAYEAQVKQQRKQERKAQRASEMRLEAEARQRQAEAEALERKKRREELEQTRREQAKSEQAKREQAKRERAKASKAAAVKPGRSATPKGERSVSNESAELVATGVAPGPRGKASTWRPGVIVTLVVLAVVAFLLISRH